MISDKEKNAIKEVKQYLSENFDLLDLRVFGSKVKETDTAESDTDIMAVLDNYDPLIEARIDSQVFKINLKHDCLISVLLYSREEIERGPLGESPLYKKVIKEGIPV